MWYLIVLLTVFVIIFFASVKIVRQSEVYVIERLGKFYKLAEAGLNIIVPFADKVRAVVSLKEQIMDVPPQAVITKDNVAITIDTVVFYQISDTQKAVYEIESLQKGIGYLAITTIRDIVGKMELDNTFSSRDTINTQLRLVLDEATDKWGCKVTRVEIKDIKAPADIQASMEKQMNAERSKRATILTAEGSRQSSITLAEGEKEAVILRAEAEKESNIRRAQGLRESQILEAEGQAIAIRSVAEAKAKEVELVYSAMKAAKPDNFLVALKTLESLEKVADGQANKIFIPFDATNALGALGAIKDVMKD